LLALVQKHQNSVFLRPVASHTQQAFEHALEWLGHWQGDVILDACCGVGESTFNLARQFPTAKIIGVDKSVARLQKHQHYARRTAASVKLQTNYIILQADLNDFWRLLSAYLTQARAKSSWRLVKQCILYPNPYPKKSQLGKRWHGSAVFPDIIDCCGNIEVRSNWKLYVEEFVMAANALGVNMQISSLVIDAQCPAMTPFERKYAEANQALWMATTIGTGCDK
jgi:tRNA G46 methylase TrmB